MMFEYRPICENKWELHGILICPLLIVFTVHCNQCNGVYYSELFSVSTATGLIALSAFYSTVDLENKCTAEQMGSMDIYTAQLLGQKGFGPDGCWESV